MTPAATPRARLCRRAGSAVEDLLGLLGRRTTGRPPGWLSTGLLAMLFTGLAPIGATPHAAAVAATGRGAAHAHAAATSPQTPLAVSLDSLTPSTIPRRPKQAITFSGTVTNRSDENWSDLNVYPFASSSPMSTRQELALASDTDQALAVGDRITDAGIPIHDLGPGDTESFSLSLRRNQMSLTGASGVYWVGIHVLGASPDGRDLVADGRARTFMPLMPRAPDPTTVSVVLPVRNQVRRTPTGSVFHASRAAARLGVDGRLGRLLGLANSTGDFPVTWLIDPAVLDQAAALGHADPQMDLGPTGSGGPAGSRSGSPSEPPSESPSASPGGSPSGSPGDDSSGPEGSPSASGDAGGSGENEQPPSPEAATAQTWLDGFRRQVEGAEVFRLPYGDLDVSAALRRGHDPLFGRARSLAKDTMDRLGVTSDEMVAPRSGFLNPHVLSRIDSAVPLLLSDHAATATSGGVLRAVGNRDLVLNDTEAASGGPSPTPALDALAVRQRVLSEAALASLSGTKRPLVVELPPRWDPGAQWRTADFFSGLEVPWVVARPLSTTPTQSTRWRGQLRYGRRHRKQEVRPANLNASQRLVGLGERLDTTLTDNDTVDDFVSQSAMLGSSSFARNDPQEARDLTRSTSGRIQSMLGRIHILAPPFVTMSSADGTFSVKVSNDLEEPVTISIRAAVAPTGGRGRLSVADPGSIDLPGGQRATVRLRATSTDIGVYSVRLLATTPAGVPLGNHARLSIRSSRVGVVIWWVMGGLGGLLFLLVGYRIVQRARSRRADHMALAPQPHAGRLDTDPAAAERLHTDGPTRGDGPTS